MNMELLCVGIPIPICNGEKANFWRSALLGAKRADEFSLLIFIISRQRNMSVEEALHDDTWINHILLGNRLSFDHSKQLAHDVSRLRTKFSGA
jgi:hypothetical protein